MKKFLVLSLLIFGGIANIFAQTTTVTATITDSDSQTWNNGTYTATLFNGQTPNGPFYLDGVKLTNAQIQVQGTMSSAGIISTTLYDVVNHITPVGSYYKVQLCPDASAPCATPAGISPTGASIDFSSTLSANLPGPRFPATGANAYGYGTFEISPTPIPGGFFFNITLNAQNQWNGTSWVTVTNSSSSFNPNWINLTLPPYYASISNTTTTTTGTNPAGISINLSSCIDFTISNANFQYGHQGVRIVGAGSAGTDYIGTVSSCNNNVMIVTPATSTSVNTGTLVQHDDSAALQAAVTNSNGVPIYLPAGIYNINGPLQNTGTANAIIQVPTRPFVDCTVTQLPITLIGDPSTVFGSGLISGGTIIKTALGTAGNVIGGYADAGGTGCFPTGLNFFTAVTLKIVNISFVGPANPNFVMVNAQHIANFYSDNIDIGCGLSPDTFCTTPTHNTSTGIILPQNLNNAEVHLDGFTNVSGYYYGIQASEHTYISSLFCQTLVSCITFAGGSNHPNVINKLNAQAVTYIIGTAPANSGGFVMLLHVGGEVISNIIQSTANIQGTMWYSQNGGTWVTPTSPVNFNIIPLYWQNLIAFTSSTTLDWREHRIVFNISSGAVLTLPAGFLGTGLTNMGYQICNNSTSTANVTFSGGGATTPASLTPGTCVTLYPETVANGGWSIY